MRDEALHAAVLAAPDDDAPRQVYADWLIEHGDPRGELINMQITRARLPKGDPRDRELAEHEDRLWRENNARWHQPWKVSGDVYPYWLSYDRGFVDLIDCRSSVLADALIERPQLLEDTCVRSLRTANVELLTIERLLPLLRLRELSITLAFHADGLARALGSPAFVALETLRLFHSGDGAFPIEAIVQARLPRLHALGLYRASLVPDTVRRLAGWLEPPPLRELALTQNAVSGAIEPLLASQLARSLERLNLASASLDDADVVAIAAAELPLIELDLTDNAIGPAAAATIASTRHFAGLRRLHLVGTQIGRAGFDALAASPYLSNELVLSIDGEVVGLSPDLWLDQGVIVGSSWFGTPKPADAARFQLDIPQPRG